MNRDGMGSIGVGALISGRGGDVEGRCGTHVVDILGGCHAYRRCHNRCSFRHTQLNRSLSFPRFLLLLILLYPVLMFANTIDVSGGELVDRVQYAGYFD